MSQIHREEAAAYYKATGAVVPAAGSLFSQADGYTDVVQDANPPQWEQPVSALGAVWMKAAEAAPHALRILASVPAARPVQPSCCPTSIRQPRVYIAGPMRDYPANNAAAFFAAHYEWAAAGWEVLNPALVDLERPLITEADVPDPESHDSGSTGNWRELVMRDCEMVCKADAIAFLRGYRGSAGAEAEWHLACWLNLPMYYQEEDGTWR